MGQTDRQRDNPSYILELKLKLLFLRHWGHFDLAPRGSHLSIYFLFLFHCKQQRPVVSRHLTPPHLLSDRHLSLLLPLLLSSSLICGSLNVPSVLPLPHLHTHTFPPPSLLRPRQTTAGVGFFAWIQWIRSPFSWSPALIRAAQYSSIWWRLDWIQTSNAQCQEGKKGEWVAAVWAVRATGYTGWSHCLCRWKVFSHYTQERPSGPSRNLLNIKSASHNLLLKKSQSFNFLLAVT